MTKLAAALSGAQPLLLAVAVIACTTAAVITGHISGADFLAVVGGTGVVGGTVATAHVVGTQVNTAASTPNPAAAATPVAAAAAPSVTTPTV